MTIYDIGFALFGGLMIVWCLWQQVKLDALDEELEGMRKRQQPETHNDLTSPGDW